MLTADSCATCRIPLGVATRTVGFLPHLQPFKFNSPVGKEEEGKRKGRSDLAELTTVLSLGTGVSQRWLALNRSVEKGPHRQRERRRASSSRVMPKSLGHILPDKSKRQRNNGHATSSGKPMTINQA
ncbi:uncharacterized [Tachysurus ichikawai]